MKFKCSHDQEFVIVGYTAPKGSRVGLGALLLGYHDGDDLRYAGKVGTGFDTATLRSLHKRLAGTERDRPTVDGGPKSAGAHWVRPTSVAQVAFSEWTRDGKLRHPRYLGLRTDKSPAEVVRESALMSAKVEITHADRVLFPSDGITKGDLVEYYTEIAGAMVPHVKDRPLTLWRYPRGIDQNGFVQQDFADSLPDWMGRVKVAKEDGTVVHPTADRRDALRWLANQNCVIVHAWLSKRDRLRHTGPHRVRPRSVGRGLRRGQGDGPGVRRRAGRHRTGVVCADDGFAGPPCRDADQGAIPTLTPCGSSPATSPMWSPPTTRLTAPSKSARPSAATGCTWTSCEMPTGRPPSRRTPCGPGAGHR